MAFSRLLSHDGVLLSGQLGEVMQESVRTALTWIRAHVEELGLEQGGCNAGLEQRGNEGSPLPTRAGTRFPTRVCSPRLGGEGEAEEADGRAIDGEVFVSPDRTAQSPQISPDLPRSPQRSLLAGIDLHVHFPAGAIKKDGPSAGTATLVALVSLLTGRRARSKTAMSGEISLRGHVLPIGGVREKVLAAHRAGITRVLLPHRNRKDLHEISAKVRDEMQFYFCETVEDVLREALVDEPHAARAIRPLGRDGSRICAEATAPPPADASHERPMCPAPPAMPQPLLASKL